MICTSRNSCPRFHLLQKNLEFDPAILRGRQTKKMTLSSTRRWVEEAQRRYPDSRIILLPGLPILKSDSGVLWNLSPITVAGAVSA